MSYKAHLINFTDTVATPPDEGCYRLTGQHVAILLSILPPIAWATRYYETGNPAWSQDQIQLWYDEIMERLLMPGCGGVIEDDDMYLLRQKPDDPCVLQQSTDNGVTWTDAFDYGLCFRNRPKTITDVTEHYETINKYVTNMQTLRDQYNGTVISIVDSFNVSWTPDVQPDTGYQCAMMTLHLEALYDMLIEIIISDSIADDDDDLLALLITAAATAIGGAIGWFVGGIQGAIVGAEMGSTIGGVLGGTVKELLDGMDIAFIRDQTNRDAITCCVLSKMPNDGIPTEAQYKDLATETGCSSLTAVQSQIRDAVHELMQQTDMYLSFLAMMDTYSGSAGALSGQCPPCASDYDWIIDNPRWTHDYVEVVRGQVDTYGDYIKHDTADGYLPSPPYQPYTYAAEAVITIPGDPGKNWFSKVRVHYTVLGQAGTNPRHCVIEIDKDGSPLHHQWTPEAWVGSWVEEVNQSIKADTLRVRIGSFGEPRLRRIEIFGKHEDGNPFIENGYS